MVILIDVIKPHVTHFSEEFKLKCECLDEVKVGGLISSITPPFIENGTDLLSYYLLKVDDRVGEFNVYVSRNMMDSHDFIKKGNLICFEGFIHTLSREIGGKVEKQWDVVAYDIKLLKGGSPK